MVNTGRLTRGWVTGFIKCSVALAVLAAAPMASAQDETKNAKQENKPLYDEKADANKQIATALAEAKKENKRVLIQWGANWCGWCTILDKHFKTNRAVARELLYEYNVIHVDVGRFDKHLDIASKLKADFKGQGVPYLTVLDADGKVLANQDTGSLEVEDKPLHDGEKVLAFLKQHEAPQLNASRVLSEAIAKAKSEDKRVFLHFGAPWCVWCHRLEDWMETEKVSALLGTNFVDCKIDVDRMIGGKELLSKYRKGEGGGIPWFCFLDETGDMLASSDGPNGNLGFPWKDEEIAAFEVILHKAANKLSDEQVSELGDSLRAFRDKKNGE